MKNRKMPLCREVHYREFPAMLFGQADNGMLYFDADHYLQATADKTGDSIAGFQSTFDFWIRAIGETCHLPLEELIVADEVSGKVWMEESLALLFIAYLDPGFAVYMLERISEMLITGIVLSDTALIRMANGRITKEDLL